MHLALALFALAPQEGAPGEDEALRALAREQAARLAAVGCAVELDELAFEVKPRAECAADLEAQLDLFYPPSYFEAMRLLYRALGASLGPDAAAARAQIARATLGGLVAYYQPERGALVLIGAGELPDVAREVVRHELVHAWRDARSGLAELFGEAPRTLERVRVAHSISEGEAEALALAAALAAEGRGLDSIDAEALDDPLARMLAGEGLSLPYTFGRRRSLERLRAEGLEGLERLWRERPASSEHVLHPEKAGADEPTAVDLRWMPDAVPKRDAVRVEHEDVLGEMALLGLLLERGAERERAWLAALGWDGDRLLVCARDGEVGLERGLAWRSVWDREEDAQQLEALWRSLSRGRTVRRGRVVDWCWAETGDLEEALALRLATRPLELGASDGAASTARLERERLARERPRVEDGWWIVPAGGLRLRAPAGWSPREIDGMPFLMGPARDGFADNANVLAQPNPPGATLAETREVYVAGLRAAGMEPGEVVERERGGRAVLELRARGRVGPNELAVVILLLPRERDRVELTFTLAAARAEELAPAVEAALASLRWE
jgi:hypothetical protein